MMQDRTFRGQSADGTWHEGFLIRSPGVKNSRPGEGWYINSEHEHNSDGRKRGTCF